MSQLDGWLREHADEAARDAVGLIGPHAGLRYSGRTAGACYAQLAKRTSPVARILLLGPSHHVGISGCALSRASSLATPLGSLPVDTAAVAALAATGAFDELTRDEDEAEHSLEMQLPYLARCLQWRAAGRVPSAGAAAPPPLAPLEAASVVPVLVGGIRGREAAYAGLLAPLLRDGRTFIVVSSDFCHWGPRFSYTRFDREAAGRSGGCIADGIEAMDRRGMLVSERAGGWVDAWSGAVAYAHARPAAAAGTEKSVLPLHASHSPARASSPRRVAPILHGWLLACAALTCSS